MRNIYRFEFEIYWKNLPKIAYMKVSRSAKLACSQLTSIMQSQHEYFFIPTTQKQILV
jgi:hypothetical protein